MKYQPSCYQSYSRIRERDRIERKAEKVIKILETFSGNNNLARCLEVGCSYGVMTKYLSDLFPSTVGVEYDRLALDSVPDDLKSSIFFVQGDGLFLPFPNDTFDLIVCTQVYEHVPDSNQLFVDLHRVLKPGGYIFFSGPNKIFPIEPHYFLPFLHWLPVQLADIYLTIFKKGDHYYEKIFTPYRLRFMLKNFKIIDLTYVVFLDELKMKNKILYNVFKKMPNLVRVLIGNISPNLNWVLEKNYE